ncbi:unnamed protein product [Miscanthus lutarioriparius]|uniref:F-box domain-containing protein n=1 Tax=Miscanthus lutarioriparius TaxID=422564 RepID=A0A811QU43_9POAL|nr:unnamed protein product [Miscanthus lutarioriparius]
MPLAAAGALPLAVTDMLHDILCLPANEVCRMQLVCRTWRSPTSDPHIARVHSTRRPAPHVIVIRHHDEDEVVADHEVRVVDLHGKVIKWRRIRRPIGRLMIVHGDLLCASHGWGLTCVVDMVAGAVPDVAAEHRKKVNSATPHCVLGHVPATGEYKVAAADVRGLILGGIVGDAGRWRWRPCPPVTLGIKPGSSSWNVAVVAGLACFLADEIDVEADRLAIFDLATEEWKPATLQEPLTCGADRLLASMDDEDEDDELIMQLIMTLIMPPYRPLVLLHRKHCQLARLGESSVVLYYNVKNGSMELWFLEDMKNDTTARWSKRYTLQCTLFGNDESLHYNYYPLRF